ncbi:MAG: hypothetical protein HQK60_13955 [Deltaproteobacteria bacterium]|nr:hypothetical protein [Deltaproteobacteria bacterium]
MSDETELDAKEERRMNRFGRFVGPEDRKVENEVLALENAVIARHVYRSGPAPNYRTFWLKAVDVLMTCFPSWLTTLERNALRSIQDIFEDVTNPDLSLATRCVIFQIAEGRLGSYLSDWEMYEL